MMPLTGQEPQIVLETIFQYAALPALFSLVTLYREGWDEAAAIMWSIMALLYFGIYGPVYVVAGMIPTIAHGARAVIYYKKNKLVTSVRHGDLEKVERESGG